MSRGKTARSSQGTVGPKRGPVAAARAGLLLLVLLSFFASCSMGITARRYALVYGAADYINITATDLQTPDDDARDMAAALSAAGWTVTVTRQPTVTRAQILSDIMALEDVVDSDSSVLIYFSGHGAINPANGAVYIVPTDEELLPSSSLLSAVSALPCRNRILVLDSCYSGGFVTVTDTGTVDSAPQNYGELDDGTASWAFFAALANYSKLLGAAFDSYNAYTPIVVTAAGAEEPSWDTYVGTEGHGVFTKYFLLAATNGDSNGDGYVTIQEAYKYAREKLEKYWNAYYYNYYSEECDVYADFLPRISGNARDVVIF